MAFLLNARSSLPQCHIHLVSQTKLSDLAARTLIDSQKTSTTWYTLKNVCCKFKCYKKTHIQELTAVADEVSSTSFSLEIRKLATSNCLLFLVGMNRSPPALEGVFWVLLFFPFKRHWMFINMVTLQPYSDNELDTADSYLVFYWGFWKGSLICWRSCLVRGSSCWSWKCWLSSATSPSGRSW